jgi:hypothetical protein
MAGYGGIWWDLVVGSFNFTRSLKLVGSVVESFGSTNFPKSPRAAVWWWKSVESTKFYCRVAGALVCFLRPPLGPVASPPPPLRGALARGPWPFNARFVAFPVGRIPWPPREISGEEAQARTGVFWACITRGRHQLHRVEGAPGALCGETRTPRPQSTRQHEKQRLAA